MKYLKLFYDSLDVLDAMTDEQSGQLFKKIRSYCNGNEYIPSDNTVNIIFIQFKNQLDRDRDAYNKICERNKANGEKGGRPKTQKNPKKPSGIISNPEKPKKSQDKDKDKDKDKDIKENIKDFFLDKDKGDLRMEIYPKDLRQDFIKYRTEPFVKGKLKGKPKWVGEKTRSLEGRLDTFLRYRLKDEGTTVAKRKDKCKKKFKS